MRLSAFDQLQLRRQQAISDGERSAIDTIADQIGRSDTIRTPHGLMRDLSRPRGSMQSWRESLYVTIADGTAVTAAAIAVLVPDFSLPANYLYPGRLLQYTLLGRQSTVITTPGTYTWALKWGGTGGTTLATSGAISPDVTAASTNVAWWNEYWMVCRSVGTSGSAFTFGWVYHTDLEDASSATLVTELNKAVYPAANAAVTINTTTANALSPCVTPSVATGSITCNMAWLEALS